MRCTSSPDIDPLMPDYTLVIQIAGTDGGFIRSESGTLFKKAKVP
jgi:hypothetical protein